MYRLANNKANTHPTWQQPRTFAASTSEGPDRTSTWYRRYHSVIAGASAGLLNCVLCAPLDVAKVRQQVEGSVAPYASRNYGLLSTLKV